MEGFAPPLALTNPRANVSSVIYGDDKGVFVLFDEEFVKNDYRSEREGRPSYDHYFTIELQWPGDKTKSFKKRFPVTEKKNEWTERFPRQWAAFQNSKEQIPDGTPVEMWPPLDKKRVYELKANKIFTVEQIAALTDSTGPVALGMEWRKLTDQAKAFLNPAASAVELSKLQRENEDMKIRMESMQQQMAAMTEGKPVPKKRGPKPKEQV